MEDLKQDRVLILVKTYPCASRKYIETVCTAGIRADGSWVRIFPISFRLYSDDQKFCKYQWIECETYKANDPRPESRHIDRDQRIYPRDRIGTENKREQRRRAILDKAAVYTRFADLRELVEKNSGSLAIFRPTSVRLRCETAKADDEKPETVTEEIRQLDLFHAEEWRLEFRRVERIPYDFKYEITDADGEKSTHKILDWELGTLFIGEKKRLGSEEQARESVKEKYGIEFLNADKIDLHLYMGTMLQFQRRHMPNPWTIIGIAPFPRISARQCEFNL